MEKNIVVTDSDGNQIGVTFPKRARGLVKSGRAEYVDDCRICLKTAHVTTVYENYTEDKNMSNVIDFNARDFIFDSSCADNKGERYFSGGAGRAAEIFELGDWNWNWSQIVSERKLEKNTDYIFRFAVTGGHNDTQDAVSKFIIVFDDNWDDRMTYAIAKSVFLPVLSKKYGDGILRVYEIAFNTGEAEKTRFIFAQQHAVIKIFPAMADEDYSQLEDMSYQQWWTEREKQLGTGNGAAFFGSNQRDINLSGAVISQKSLEKVFSHAPFGSSINLSGAVIGDDEDEVYEEKDERKTDDCADSGESDACTDTLTKLAEAAKKAAKSGMKISLDAMRKACEKMRDGSTEKTCMEAAIREVEQSMSELETE